MPVTIHILDENVARGSGRRRLIRWSPKNDTVVGPYVSVIEELWQVPHEPPVDFARRCQSFDQLDTKFDLTVDHMPDAAPEVPPKRVSPWAWPSVLIVLLLLVSGLYWRAAKHQDGDRPDPLKTAQLVIKDQPLALNPNAPTSEIVSWLQNARAVAGQLNNATVNDDPSVRAVKNSLDEQIEIATAYERNANDVKEMISSLDSFAGALGLDSTITGTDIPGEKQKENVSQWLARLSGIDRAEIPADLQIKVDSRIANLQRWLDNREAAIAALIARVREFAAKFNDDLKDPLTIEAIEMVENVSEEAHDLDIVLNDELASIAELSESRIALGDSIDTLRGWENKIGGQRLKYEQLLDSANDKIQRNSLNANPLVDTNSITGESLDRSRRQWDAANLALLDLTTAQEQWPDHSSASEKLAVIDGWMDKVAAAITNYFQSEIDRIRAAYNDEEYTREELEAEIDALETLAAEHDEILRHNIPSETDEPSIQAQINKLKEEMAAPDD